METVSKWFKSLRIETQIRLAEEYTNDTGDNTNIVNGLNAAAEKWLWQNNKFEISIFKSTLNLT